MSLLPLSRRRRTVLAFGLVAALAGCGGADVADQAPAASEPEPVAEVDDMAIALEGLSFEVHRDPG